MATADGPSLPTSIAQTLPPYIIYEILRHFSAPLVLHQIAQYPWYLAHVCSSWRIEFFTMRQNFWNEIIVRVRHSGPGMEEMYQRIIDVLIMFLECNRGHPFSFELDVQPGAARKSPHFFTIFDLFISESSRWRRVTLAIDPHDIPGFHRAKGQLEHLESLFFWNRVSNHTLPDTFTDFFMIAPCFTRLSLNGLSTLNFNWSIVTFMCLGCHQGREVARLPSILSLAVRLETLIIYIGGETLPSITSIVLPSLRLLVTDSISLIQAITTPSLKELVVHFLDRRPGLVGALKSFFGRSRCHPQVLGAVSMNAASVIEILSHTPDIRTLYLAYVSDSVVDVFRWLNGTDRVETPKLVCLQSLAVYHCPFPGQDQMHKILDFVTQRTTQAGSAVKKLQKVNIDWEWHEDRKASEALGEQLRKTCQLYDIQYSNKCQNKVYPVWEDVHDRSQDPYMYPLDE